MPSLGSKAERVGVIHEGTDFKITIADRVKPGLKGFLIRKASNTFSPTLNHIRLAVTLKCNFTRPKQTQPVWYLNQKYKANLQLQ